MRLGRGRFLSPLACIHVYGQRWILSEPLIYIDSYGVRHEVPKAFQTDLASTPRIFWQIAPPTGEYDEPAVIHDYAYATGKHPRYTADWLMLDSMISKGCNPVVSFAFFVMLRMFGWIAWNKHRN